MLFPQVSTRNIYEPKLNFNFFFHFTLVSKEKERFTLSNCKSNDEPLSQGKKQKFEWDLSYLKNFCYNLVYIKACVVATTFCNCSGCNLGKCKRRIDESNLYADALVLMSESMENLKEKFLK